jgi:hypothetical protein
LDYFGKEKMCLFHGLSLWVKSPAYRCMVLTVWGNSLLALVVFGRSASLHPQVSLEEHGERIVKSVSLM